LPPDGQARYGPELERQYRRLRRDHPEAFEPPMPRLRLLRLRDDEKEPA
jgi:hypothetical protein